MRTLAAAACSALVLALALEAGADEKESAKKHFDIGLSLVNAEDFAGAATEFEESVGMYPTKNALFNLANCHKALQQFEAALATLGELEASFGATLDPEMRGAVDKMKREIEALIGTLEIRVNRDGAAIFLNGELVGTSPLPKPLLLGPGPYEIRVEAEGSEPATQSVRLVSGDAQRAEIDLVAAAGSAGGPGAPGGAAPSNGEHGRPPAVLALGIVSTAAAVGLGVVAGVFFGKSAGYEDDYLAARDDYLALGETDGFTADAERRLYGDMKDARDGVATSDRVAVGTLVGAGVAAAASVVLWIIYAKSGPESADAAPVSLAPAPGGFVGSF